MAASGAKGVSSVDVIAQIYEAAFDREAFGRLGGVIAAATRSTNGVVVLREASGPVDLSATTSLEALQAYLEYYGRIDPFTATAAAQPLGTVVRSEDHLSDSELERHEFYADYASKLEMYHPAGVILPIGPGMLMALGVNRPRRAARFDGQDTALLAELARHVQRAMQLRERLQVAQAQAEAGFAVLDRLTFGVVVADGDGRIVFVNQAAETLHRSGAGISLAGGRLGAASSSEAGMLARLLREAAGGRPGGAMRLSGAARARELLALVLPLPRRLCEGGNPNLAMVALRARSDAADAPASMLAQLFGLSAAEAEVVTSLARGRSLDDIAERRGVKITTLRTQLEAIFRKTHTSGQRELLQLIGSIPQAR